MKQFSLLEIVAVWLLLLLSLLVVDLEVKTSKMPLLLQCPNLPTIWLCIEHPHAGLTGS